MTEEKRTFLYDKSGKSPSLPVRRRSIGERIASFWEVDRDVITRIPVITIRGKTETEIYGCRGILEYGRDRIVLAVGEDVFTVCGEDLLLEDFRERSLYVRGTITSVTLEKAGEDTSC